MKRIGITIDCSKQSIWSSGINQNAVYLCKILKIAGYSVDLISQDKCNERMAYELDIILNEKVVHVSTSFKRKYDLIINLGITLNKNTFKSYVKSNKNVKLVQYKCGNNFIVDMESILFNTNVERTESFSNFEKPVPDQIWYIPQMEKTNDFYYRFEYQQENSTVVPFIWSPIAVETYNKSFENVGYSTYSKRDIKRLAIMEPNISVMKNVLHPIISVDRLYQNFKFDKLMLIGASNIKSNKKLIQVLSNTQMFNDKKVTAEDRHPTLKILNEYADLVLSWQWENNLNYLYLDVAWMGWPIVHNANLCPDVGYYYEGFDAEDAAEKMKYAIENHNQDLDYLQRNREIIKRYTQENPKLIEQYRELVEDVLNNRFKKRTYDWKTNSVI